MDVSIGPKRRLRVKEVMLFFLCFFFLVLPFYCYQPMSLQPRAHMLSHVTPRIAACQAPLSMDFSRQEYWSGLPFSFPRIDAFKLWCWRRLLRVPWTARRSNQSILKETNPEYSLKRRILKLNLQYFGHLMWRADSLEKTDAGEDWGQEEKGVAEDEMVGWHHRHNGR